jgi:hypothetical protein
MEPDLVPSASLRSHSGHAWRETYLGIANFLLAFCVGPSMFFCAQPPIADR